MFQYERLGNFFVQIQRIALENCAKTRENFNTLSSFSFPKCVNGKIFSLLKFFIIKKTQIKKLEFNNLKTKQAK